VPHFANSLPLHHSSSGRNDKKKLAPLQFEQSLHERDYRYVIGTDEVGRGSIAGPVLAVSCCIINNQAKNENVIIPDYKITKATDDKLFFPIQDVADSKTLTPQKRQKIYDEIILQSKYYRYAITQRSPAQIDETNIFKATMACFQESIQNLILHENLPQSQTYAIVDGKSTPKLVNGPTPIPCRPLVSADSLVYTVSVASIIAKQVRDNIMIEAHEKYPEYGFRENKGYLTKEHIESIHKHGPCPLHRMSFKALKYR